MTLILGCETPRIFTPPRAELTEDTTDGFAAIAFAERILGIKLFPWQKWLLCHALELNEDWSYRYRTVIVTEARQNGKTLLMVLLALWHLYAKGSRTVIATAQDLSKADDSWLSAVEWAQESEELSELIRKVTLAHPKVLTVMNPITEKLCQYRVASSSRRAARGFSGDLILLDELREHQSWDSWAAVTKTMLARPRAQAWCFSNAADATGVVLRYQRAKAHRGLGWPDGDGDVQGPVIGDVAPDVAALLSEYGDSVGVGWFEWSVPPNAKRSDRAAWAQANGSMNHTEVSPDCITDRAIAHALGTDPVDVFDTEVLCRQIDTAGGGPYPEGSWKATTKSDARPSEKARSALCIEVSTSRAMTFIAKAAKRDDIPVVGILEGNLGTDWVKDWCVAHRADYSGIVIRSGSGAPARSLYDELEEARLPLIDWTAGDVGSAHGQMFDLVAKHTVEHLPHPGLDGAATSAAIKMQPAGGWIVDSLKSPTDVAPLYAAIGAVWGLSQLPDDGPSIYSNAGGARDVLVF
jgi:hypothetical protein